MTVTSDLPSGDRRRYTELDGRMSQAEEPLFVGNQQSDGRVYLPHGEHVSRHAHPRVERLPAYLGSGTQLLSGYYTCQVLLSVVLDYY